MITWFIIVSFIIYSYLTFSIINIASSTEAKLIQNDSISTPKIRHDTSSTPDKTKAHHNIIQQWSVQHPFSDSDLCVSKIENSQRCRLSPCNNMGDTDTDVSRLGYGGQIFHRDNSIIKGAQKSPSGGRKGQASGCIMSHKYKFIYIHVLKSGGSAIKHFLKRGLCQVPGLHDECKNDETYYFTGQSCNDMVREHPDYFVWAMVRNPFSRMYSAYSMLYHHPRNEESKQMSFADFVLGDNRFRRSLSNMSPIHYHPQHKNLFDLNECPNFDFTGRLENIDKDMAFILKQINSPELDMLFESSNNTMPKENNYGENDRKKELGDNLKRTYEDEMVVRKVGKEFGADFRLLGYNNLKVPEK